MKAPSLDARIPLARFFVIAAGTIAWFAAVGARLATVVCHQGDHLAAMAAQQHRVRITVTTHRADIVDRTGEVLAASVRSESIYARPRELVAGPGAAERLAAILEMDPEEMRARLASRAPFVWLRRRVTPRQAAAVMGLGLPGIGRVSEPRRYYPGGQLAAHVLGFAGVDDRGLAGVELAFDDLVRGDPRRIEVERDARGRGIVVRGGAVGAEESRARAELTLDAPLQDLAERELARTVHANEAAAGVVIILDPSTGEILALANMPACDPNNPAGRRPEHCRNRAVTDLFEPGSTVKALLAAAALAEGVVEPGQLIFCEEGRYRTGRRWIHDHTPNGWLTFADVIRFSSNIGAAKVAAALGASRYHDFLRRFGFGRPTGIDLPGEVAGSLRPAKRWRPVDLATASFGQGIAATPLQIAAAFAILANGGWRVRPHVVRRIFDARGQLVYEAPPQPRDRVIGADVARQVTRILRQAVEGEGSTGTRAGLSGIAVAGKTGTAQKIDPATGRYGSGRVASFAGYAPAEKPRVVVLVLVDEPRTVPYGGVVAAPLFREVTRAALARAGIYEPPAGEAPDRRRVEVVAAPPIPSRPGGGAPDLRGLSLREALIAARRGGWRVKIRGTGFVTHQNPPAGSSGGGRREIALTFEPPLP